MKPWPNVSLGELLRLERRKVEVEPEKPYQEIGIYCSGRGIFHKTPRTGFEDGDKDLFLMKEGGSGIQRRAMNIVVDPPSSDFSGTGLEALLPAVPDRAFKGEL